MENLRSTIFRCVAALSTILAIGTSSANASVTVPLDPRATYLRTFLDFGSQDTIPIPLALVGANPGDVLLIEQLGDFSFDVIGPPVRPDNVTNMIAVFSSSNVLLPNFLQNRIPGALFTVGVIPIVPWASEPTFTGGLPTDIPQDFYTSPLSLVVVPAGAQFLFVAPSDSRYYDNGDPNQNYAVRLTVFPVPETSSLALAGVGLVGLAGAYIRRRQP